MSLWEKIYSKDFLNQAWQSVYRNSSSSGIDKITTKKFSENYKENLDNVFNQLKSGKYEFLPVLKINAKKRALVIPTVNDRIVMKSTANSLINIFEKQFCNCSYAYRPHKSTINAIKDIENAIKENYQYFYKTDIKTFFEAINHNILLKKIDNTLNNDKIINFIEKFLKSKVYDTNNFFENTKGVHQGSPVSPLLSNIYLNSFDKNILENNFKVFRYCDDILILSKKEDQLFEAEQLIKNQLTLLDLSINKDKEIKGEIRDGFNFLGYFFNKNGKSISKKAIESLDSKIQIVFSNNNPSFEKSKKIITGWENYFGKLDETNINSLETLLAFFKKGNYSNIEEIIIARKKLKSFSESHIHLALAQEWKELDKIDFLNYEVFCFINKINPNEEIQIISLAKLLNIDFKSLKTIISYFQKNNFDISFFIQGLVDFGYYALAKEFHKIQNNLSLVKNETYGIENANKEFFNRYIDLFSSNLNYFSIESEGLNQKRIFTKIPKKLDEEAIKSNLEGEITLVAPVFSNNEKTKMLIFDIDISKELLNDSENYTKNSKKVLLDAIKISKELEVCGLSNIIEFSGNKGYHVWVFFDQEIEALLVRKLAFAILKKIGKPEIGINREIFPNKDYLSYDEESCLIKLPLGFHVISKKPCFFIDQKGNTYSNQIKTLNNIKKITYQEFTQALHILETEEKLFVQEKRIELNIDMSKFPKVQKILNGCGVLNYVIKKAEETGYINHKERMLLLSTLGHVKNEGQVFIHEIMKKCFNYDKNLTNSYLNKIAEKPIGCKRIKETYQEITCFHNCSCIIYNSDWSYQTPIAYSEMSKNTTKEVKQAISNTITKNEKEIKLNIQDYIKRLADLKKQLKGVEKAINICESNLDTCFDELGVEQIEINSGLLVRDKSENIIKWRIEI